MDDFDSYYFLDIIEFFNIIQQKYEKKYEEKLFFEKKEKTPLKESAKMHAIEPKKTDTKSQILIGEDALQKANELLAMNFEKHSRELSFRL